MTYRPAVTNEHIASTLPIDTEFTTVEFSKLTGVDGRTSYNRVKVFKDKGWLTKVFGKGALRGRYTMSVEQREIMLGNKKEVKPQSFDKLLFSAPWV